MAHIEQILDTKQLRRMRSEDRALERIEQQEAAAKPLIGQLCREGKTIYYVVTARGKYREGKYYDLIDYLTRTKRI